MSTANPPKPSYHLTPLLLSDAPQAISIYFSAFATSPHSLACFPRNASSRSWLENMVTSELDEPGAHWLKVLHPGTGEMVAFGKWVERRSDWDAKSDSEGGLPTIWPEGADERVCLETFGAWEREHGRLMGGKAHWYLEILATDPAHQGKGVGSQMIRWGLEHADAAGMEAYLEGAPDAVKLYERFGFREVGRTETWIEGDQESVRAGVLYANLFMLRPKKE